jgi:RNA polymerase sigma-70 factor, ECF subfamily
MVALVLKAVQLPGQSQTGGDAASLDAGLLAAAARGDRNAFEQIVGRYYQIVYRVVWRMMHGHRDAEDVTQEAFLRLWRNPTQLRDAGALRAWLIRVATNLITDRHRGQPMSELTEADDTTDGRPSPERSLEQSQITARVEQAIARLPERQRLALTLVQYEHMSNPEAARVMEISVDALESLLSRARRALKDDFANDWQALLQGLAGET